MKVIAFVGSSRTDGNTSKVVGAVCAGMKESGHSVEICNLSELGNKGCRACGSCQAGKVEYCAVDDRVTALLPKVADADCIVLGTPVYMMHLSGTAKNFIDRLFAFYVQSNHTARCLPGKKYITVTCSGAPAGAFNNVTEYLNQLFEGAFQMKNSGNIIVGNVLGKDDVLNQRDILKTAEDVGRKLK